jgi:hypothetical protein
MSETSAGVVVALVTMSADRNDWRDVSASVIAIDVEDDDELTDMATITFDDPTAVLAQLSFEGLLVRVALGRSGRTATLFEGIITSAKVHATTIGQRIELTALDFTWMMTRRPLDPMEWKPGETLKAVLTRVVGRPEYHLTPFQIEPAQDTTQAQRRPVRPANLNEWEFVLDQARRQNCLAFVEFDGESASNFYFVPLAKVMTAEPVGTLRYARGYGSLLEFTYERVTSTAAPILHAASIDPTTGIAVDHPAADSPPRAILPAPVTDSMPHLGPGRRAAVESLAELSTAADARLTRPRSRVSGLAAGSAADLARRTMSDPTMEEGMLGRGVAAGTTALRAKARVQIAGVAPWAEGIWYLRRVNHRYQRAHGQTATTYLTAFTASR